MTKFFLLLSVILVFSFSANAQRVSGQRAEAVAAGGYWYLPVKSNGNLRLWGKFRARGGSGNDIQVLILDADGFENWSNGHSTETYYNSGKVTVGTFDVNLPRGTFYLVLNNRFSTFTSKAVQLTFFE